MIDEKYPYSVPLNFAVKLKPDSTISLYFHGANAGKKISLLRKNPHVSFAMSCSRKIVEGIPDCQSTMKYESVCGTGKVTFLGESDLNEKCLALSEIMKHHFPNNNHTFSAKEAEMVAILRLDVDEVTGKRNI
ncbi:pyridoxamine 5'-phosphate oxidase family protein [Histomonas meleagridis]|uniref:pyridoxamine 5'-phosphate oxidase family protein n=1 Tax=Histomonas meleagridis TaxID=135588 RepID=UPI00355A58F7|nr:pyridoxamine 5'-phosphate oxidase family protein [Histomonas meleagridis]KAH0805785.1 pyridoxamine 5'-phosphate oxidase family protein [Histomonas meleagridis]